MTDQTEIIFCLITEEPIFFLKSVFSRTFFEFIVSSQLLQIKQRMPLGCWKEDWNWANREEDLNTIWHYHVNNFKAVVNWKHFNPSLKFRRREILCKTCNTNFVFKKCILQMCQHIIRQKLSFQCQQEIERRGIIPSGLQQVIIPVFKNKSRPLNSISFWAVPGRILGAKLLILLW